MNWYLKVLKNYFQFSGRARRKEYWMFILFNILFALLAMVLDNLAGTTFTFDLGYGVNAMPYGYIYLLYAIAVFIPGLSVLVRRLHDIGKSGWMFLVAFIPIAGAIWLLILLLKDSMPGVNQYGPNPKEEQTLV